MGKNSTCLDPKTVMYALEREIISDKLAAGVNGVEWLVLNSNPKESRVKGLADWFEGLSLYGFTNHDAVMRDALTMDSDSFYTKYEFNWWISVSYALTYLTLLRNDDYDSYFDFLTTLGNRIKQIKNQDEGSHNTERGNENEQKRSVN